MVVAATRRAIRSHLEADESVTSLLADPEAIFHRIAPQKSSFPFIVFHRIPGSPVWTFRNYHVVERWEVKGVCRGGSATPAEDIADAVRDSLNDAKLEVDGAVLLCFRWERDIDYAEQDGAQIIHHVGCQFKFSAKPGSAGS